MYSILRTFGDSWKVLWKLVTVLRAALAPNSIFFYKTKDAMCRRADEGVRGYTTKNAPVLFSLAGKDRGTLVQLALLRSEVLVVAQADYVLEHGRAGRQVRRIQELGVEEIVTFWGAVHRIATFEIARVVLRVVHADH